MDVEKVINGLKFTKKMITFNPSTGEDIEPGNLNEADKTSYDACVGAIALLKEQEKIKSQEEFSKIIHGMFDYLWDCEIEHPIFQDTVGDLMNAVIQAYGLAVKLND